MIKVSIYGKRVAVNYEEVGYSNFTPIQKPEDFKYKNAIEKLYYESIGKHLSPILQRC
jgi:hypothetical protein